MSKTKRLLFLLSVIGLMVISTAEIFAESTTANPAFTIRKVEQQAVLYTICRGSYDKSGTAVGRLFALAGQKGMTPKGPPLYVYLNNPQYVSSEHWLTEIRIPVDDPSLKFAGTLGEMTDVKLLKATDVAVVIKPEGMADPAPIYDQLQDWILKQGYTASEGPLENFLTNPAGENYAQMKTEIMIPVKKVSKCN